MKKLLLSCQNPLIFCLILAVLLAGAGLNANAEIMKRDSGESEPLTKEEKQAKRYISRYSLNVDNLLGKFLETVNELSQYHPRKNDLNIQANEREKLFHKALEKIKKKINGKINKNSRKKIKRLVVRLNEFSLSSPHKDYAQFNFTLMKLKSDEEEESDEKDSEDGWFRKKVTGSVYKGEVLLRLTTYLRKTPRLKSMALKLKKGALYLIRGGFVIEDFGTMKENDDWLSEYTSAYSTWYWDNFYNYFPWSYYPGFNHSEYEYRRIFAVRLGFLLKSPKDIKIIEQK